MGSRAAWVLLGLLALGVGCGGSPQAPRIHLGAPGTSVTHAVVEVQQGTVTSAVHQLSSQVSLGDRRSAALLPEERPATALSWPITYAVEMDNDAQGMLDVRVDALGPDGAQVGRALGSVRVVNQGGVRLVLVLGQPCALDAECSDGVFCNGAEACVQGVCGPGPDPCPASSFACVGVQCVEAAASCAVEVDHTQCAPLDTGQGGTEPTYCDAASGCQRGVPCTKNQDCQNNRRCDGEEQCVSGRCEPGVRLVVADDLECTRDLCTETGGVIHPPAPDGNRCAQGVCSGGECRPSSCGDGVTDASRNEECDTGPANSATLPNACRPDCTRARCGDGVQDAQEACDDALDPDPGCSDTCELNFCGDGVLDPSREACDDGNTFPNDACLPDCRVNVCGDGVVNRLAEPCDDGNDVQTDGCTTVCQLARCGDGHVWAGREACDDGNTDSGDGCRRDCRKAEVCGDAVLDSGEACDDGNTNRVDGCTDCLITRWDTTTALGGALSQQALRQMVGEVRDFDVESTGQLVVLMRAAPGTGLPAALMRLDPATGTLELLAGATRPGFLETARGFASRATPMTEVTNVSVGPNNVPVARTRNSLFKVLPERVEVLGRSGRRPEYAGSTAVFSGNVGGVGTPPYPLVHNPDGDPVVTTVFGATTLDSGSPSTFNLGGTSVTSLAFDPAGCLLAGFSGRVMRYRYGSCSSVQVGGTLLAGSFAQPGNTGDGGSAVAARIGTIEGMAWGPAGELLMADTRFHTIRRVDASGIIHNVLGTGRAGFTPDGPVPSGGAPLTTPARVRFWGQDVLFVDGGRLRRLSGGVLSTVLAPLLPQATADAATGLSLGLISTLAGHPQGGVLFTTAEDPRILRLDPQDRVTVFAGTGLRGRAPDGALATASPLDVSTLAVEPDGTAVFVENTSSLFGETFSTLRTITPQGNLTTRGSNLTFLGRLAVLAGGVAAGQAGYLWRANGGAVAVDPQSYEAFCDDGCSYTYFFGAGSVAMLPDTTLVLARNHELTRVEPDFTATRLSGETMPGTSADGVPLVDARWTAPEHVARAPDGTLHVSEPGRIARIPADLSTVTTEAGGTGTRLHVGMDLPAREARIHVDELAVDGAGAVYFAENRRGQGAVFRLNPDGVLHHAAGRLVPATDGTGRDALPVSLTALLPLGDCWLLADGHLSNLRRWCPAGGTLDSVSALRDTRSLDVTLADWPAVSVRGMVRHPSTGVIYAATSEGVLRLDPSAAPSNPAAWTSSLVVDAGNTESVIGGAAVNARLALPVALALDATTETLWVADERAHAVVRIRLSALDAADAVTVALGTAGTPGRGDFGTPGGANLLNSPAGLALAPDGTLYVADTGNHLVHRRDPDGTVRTVAGVGVAALQADGRPASRLSLDTPHGLALDESGNLMVTCSHAAVVLPAGPDGRVDGQGLLLTVMETPGGTGCLGPLFTVGPRATALLDMCRGALMTLEHTP